ncbi:hypothetical protein DSAG12_03365 [Promethearchaeum syntrophicum]|uniref:Uncharacterized protein n=1 Tax=Promethearchaeum syntrophicum TaxID=2594042 RepID=A0A5B9DE54_9ARCH|nr:hypothetical protein [Candidatus Prometheoarchaeum syntrophicum]QEE17528.1 hypothetical protein DSAG12_03365 [Candidatus Prometheoarchaeum syntrophicum]
MTSEKKNIALSKAFKDEKEEKFQTYDRSLLGITSIICGIIIVVLAILGPLFLNIINYKTSQSGIWQVLGQDLANLILLAPICIVGGILHLKKREAAKYFLILPAITLIYTGLSYGIGQEWNHPELLGNYNVEKFFWIYLILIIGGLIMIIFSLPLFNQSDVPKFNPKTIKIYALSVIVFLVLFAMMWLKEVFEVVQFGDTVSGSYSATPVVFWVIRYLDLGFTIPLGIIGMYIFITRPQKAYSIMLLFFGFFTTMIFAVNMMGWIMFFNHDPELQIETLAIFSVLFLLSYGGFYYLIKDKVRLRSKRFIRNTGK